MFLIFLLVLAAGVGLFAYLDARARRQADEAWTAFSDREPRVRADRGMPTSHVPVSPPRIPKTYEENRAALAGREADVEAFLTGKRFSTDREPHVGFVERGRYTAIPYDTGPSAYVTDVATGYVQPATESTIAAWSASETSGCSYDSTSSYSDSSSSCSDSSSAPCSCD